MATFSKLKLSGSSDGRQIKVVATSSPGTTIHTAVAGVTEGIFDEIWLYAYNSHSADVLLTLQWGGTASPDDDVKVSIPYQQGRFLVVAGEILQNTTLLRAYATVGSVILISGYVNAIRA